MVGDEGAEDIAKHLKRLRVLRLGIFWGLFSG